MATPMPTVADPFYLDDGLSQTPNGALKSGRKFVYLGQTVSTLASTVANQPVGTVAIGALNAAATTTVTITNSLIVATSFVFCQIAKCTTVAGAGAVATLVCAPRVPGTGSCVVDVTNLGSAATLSTDYQLWYWIVN